MGFDVPMQPIHTLTTSHIHLRWIVLTLAGLISACQPPKVGSGCSSRCNRKSAFEAILSSYKHRHNFHVAIEIQKVRH
jgi:hypothetical protein